MDINDDNIDIDQLLKLANSIAHDNAKNNIPMKEAQLINNSKQQSKQQVQQSKQQVQQSKQQVQQSKQQVEQSKQQTTV